MAYVTEIRLSGGRAAWNGVTPSCPEVDLEVIEEYLQEHSLEVQPAHTPASPPTTMAQQTHTHTHQGTRIIGECVDGKDDNGDDVVCFCVYFYICFCVWICTENNWSGQHAYEWHCGSHTPNEEYEEQAPQAWSSHHNNQWVSSRPYLNCLVN